MFERKSTLEKVKQNAKKFSPLVFCYRAVRKVKGKVYDVAASVGKAFGTAYAKVAGFALQKRAAVTVIIPTYKKNEYFDQCIDSVINQRFPKNRLKIIVAYNAYDADYLKYLRERFDGDEMVSVVDTKGKGLGHARNVGVEYVTTPYVTYLDDDDFFTPGHIATLVAGLRKGVSVVCGRVVDFDEATGNFNGDTYVNRTLLALGEGQTSDYIKSASLLSLFWGKLYKTSLIKDKMGRFDASLVHTEDIVFWCENFDKLEGDLYLCDGNGSEGCIRRLTADSMSRPQEDKQFNFCVPERIKIIERFSELMFNPEFSPRHKTFIMLKINSQTNYMLNYYNGLQGEIKQRAWKLIKQSDAFYLNKSKFAPVSAIAFCHNFSPWADASAYVAVKRLAEIEEMEGEPLKWSVVCGNMEACRPADRSFGNFYARYCYDDITLLPDRTYFNEQSQWNFGQKAFEFKKDQEAAVIYSRSFFAGSHIAAYKYKQAHPQAKWYAEFSDPVYYGTDSLLRKTARQYEGDEAFLNTFWRDVELMVYELADVVIYTNENQREYMLGYIENEAVRSQVMKKSVVRNHPVIDAKFARVLSRPVQLDKSKKNIGYFGTFYANRTYEHMLSLLEDENTVLHIYTPAKEEVVQELIRLGKGRIVVSDTVGHLEFLSIAAQMDYLYLNDIDFEGGINPYLPSKFADYLSSGTPIIAKIKQGSPMCAAAMKRKEGEVISI